MPDQKITTIRVTVETRNRLAQLGGKDQSFDDIINKLLDKAHSTK